MTRAVKNTLISLTFSSNSSKSLKHQMVIVKIIIQAFSTVDKAEFPYKADMFL